MSRHSEFCFNFGSGWKGSLTMWVGSRPAVKSIATVTFSGDRRAVRRYRYRYHYRSVRGHDVM